LRFDHESANDCTGKASKHVSVVDPKRIEQREYRCEKCCHVQPLNRDRNAPLRI